jgi:uncharacterized membrane protein YkvA (DUF1232 family)
MPTRPDFDFNRSVAKLDLSPAHSGVFTPGIESIDITAGQLRRFNELAHSLNEAMPALTADQVAGVARRVLRGAATGGQSPFVASRLRRAAEMRALSAEPAWTSAPLPARRIHDLLAYLDDPNDLIRDEIPVIGRLDDALLVDIAMDTLREEVEDYAEFRRYRFSEAARSGFAVETLDLDRAQWQVEREDELRLEKHLRRVRDSEYAATAAERVFRVC